jgi:tetratricopeptide (TPR) repeat protein
MSAHAALARLLARRIDDEADDAARFEQLRRVGQLLVEAGEAEEAMTYLSRALALKPDDFATMIAVADARIGAGHTDQARELLERGIGALRARRSPELSQLRHRMARLSHALGDEQARYDWLNSALEADMNNGDVASELAIVAQAEGHLDTALKALRAITMMKSEASMSRAEAFYRQAIIVAQKGEPRRAVLWAKKAKAEDQHFPGVDRLIAELESA